jgi:hypothetical protein
VYTSTVDRSRLGCAESYPWYMDQMGRPIYINWVHSVPESAYVGEPGFLCFSCTPRYETMGDAIRKPFSS